MTDTRSTTLYCREGSSDKEYQLRLEEKDGGYVVNFAFGRRGSPLKPGTKTSSPVDLAAATKIYDKLLKEKTGKGYTEAESGMRYVGTDLESRDSGLSPQLPTAILQDEISRYENDDAWVGQEKFDGENRMITVENDVVGGVNRKGLTCPVPEHWFAERMSPSGRTVLCGEDMGATLIVFDAVEIDGQCIRERSFEERQRMLEAFFVAAGEPEWMRIAPVAVGTAAKRALLARMVAEHGEGIVYKRASAAFDAGRTKNAFKHKLQESSTFEVTKVNAQRSVAIVLRDADGGTVPMGNVTVPANHEVPAVGALVEVEYMYRYEDGALEQPKYKGVRTDLEGPTPLSDITRIKRKSVAA
jgi:bifunctional non-homologous end joining protein LigD